jgi:hypothetical protein
VKDTILFLETRSAKRQPHSLPRSPVPLLLSSLARCMWGGQSGAHAQYRPQDWKQSKCRETLNDAGARQPSHSRGTERLSLRAAYDKVRSPFPFSTLHLYRNLTPDP